MTARWMGRLPRPQACLTMGSRVIVFTATVWLVVLAIPWAQAGQGPPTLSSFTPICGGAGTSVIITGTDFIGATSVRFNGVAATFTVESSTQITATVPSGASTGKISVTNPRGTAVSTADFSIPCAPTIARFSPGSGRVETVVTITGTAFTGASSVRFNGVAATFTVKSSTQITATVPSGASTGKISVTTLGGTATSSASFTVTGAPGLSRWWIALVSAAALAAIGGLVVRKIHQLGPPTGRISVRLRRGEPEVLVVAEPDGSPRHAVLLIPRPDPGVQQVRERSPR